MLRVRKVYPNDRAVHCLQFFYFNLYLFLAHLIALNFKFWMWPAYLVGSPTCTYIHIITFIFFFCFYITWVASNQALFFSPQIDFIYFICMLKQLWRCVQSNLPQIYFFNLCTFTFNSVFVFSSWFRLHHIEMLESV